MTKKILENKVGHFGRLQFFSLKLHAFHCLNWQLTLTFNVFPAQKVNNLSKEHGTAEVFNCIKGLGSHAHNVL